jgi:hypothetical protein
MKIFDMPHWQREFKRLYKQKLTDKEIGAHIGVCKETVGTYRRSLGLDGNGGSGHGGYRVNNTTRAGQRHKIDRINSVVEYGMAQEGMCNATS